MTENIKNFDNAIAATTAFKITAQVLIDQGAAAVSEHDPADDTPYQALSNITKTIPFSAAAISYADMLEVVPSPLAERIALMAVEHSKRFSTGGEQVINQLYLADVSGRVPGFGEEISPAKELRDEVIEMLMEERLLPSSIIKLHEEMDLHLKDLSYDGRVILATSIYDGVHKLCKLSNPSPNLASRMHGILLGNIELAEVDRDYGVATEALFDIAPISTQRAILDERIHVAEITPAEEDPVGNDPILSRYGKALEDFQHKDGTFKTADYFIIDPNGRGQTLPLDLGSPDPAK